MVGNVCFEEARVFLLCGFLDDFLASIERGDGRLAMLQRISASLNCTEASLSYAPNGDF
jgi:hypothetical protein